MKLFRSMMESKDGLPEPGPNARKLGVRLGDAATADVQAVKPDDHVVPSEGMSVAPNDPMNLQRHRRPTSLGGFGRDPVWYIEDSDLSPDLQYCPDTVVHGVISPIQPMTLYDFESALLSTRSQWKLHCR
jgi:hypothetical protein